MKLEGYTGNPIDADEWGNIKARAIIRDEMNDASFQEKAYAWTSTYTTAGAEAVMYVKNTSTSNLELHSIILGTSTNTVFTVSKVTGTASGTAITGLNLNLGSTNQASVTSLGNAAVTGLTQGASAATIRVLANYSDQYDFKGAIIMTPNTAIAIYCSALITFEATLYGHFNSLETK